MKNRKEIIFKKLIDECKNNISAYGRFEAYVNHKLAGRYFISSKSLFKLSKQTYPEEFLSLVKSIISKRSLDETRRKEDFLKIQKGKELASFFDLPYHQFLYTLGLIPGASKNSSYFEFSIPKKSGGFRQISSPNKKLLNIQRSLCHVLNLLYTPPKSAHGFISSQVTDRGISQIKNIVTNANQHKNKKLVLNIDLKDFFPSITGARIFKLFQAKPFSFNPKVAGILTEICIHNERKCLPQGAATSPILSNMIALRLDIKLMRLAADNQLTFTRYADDITFSTSRDEFPDNLAEKIRNIIKEEGFECNEAKFRIQNRKMRQEVTGIIVNKKLNVTRNYIRNVRAMLNNWQKSGREECQRKLEERYSRIRKDGIPDFEKVLLGKIEYIGAVRGKTKKEDPQEIYVKFKNKFQFLSNGGLKDVIAQNIKLSDTDAQKTAIEQFENIADMLNLLDSL